MIHIGRAGAILGSFSEDEVRQGLVTGRFSLTDLGWKEGMAAWAPLSTFTEITAPPPLPEPTPEIPHEPPQPAGIPWDERGDIGLFRAFAGTSRLVLLRPLEAFSRMRVDTPLSSPLLYNLIGGWLGLVASALYAVLIVRFQPQPANPTQLQQLFALTPARAMQELKLFLIMGPVLVTASSLVCAGIAHLFLMLAGGANKPYHVTLRVFCFSYGSAQLLQLLPFCGSLAAPVWLLVGCVVGLAAAHGTSTGRSMTAMGLFLAACCLCCFGIFFLALGASFEALRPMLNQ